MAYLKSHKVILSFFIVVFTIIHTGVQARTAGIAATVNEDAISMSDLNDRMELIIVSSGLPDNPDIRSKLLPQVLGSLIDEQLMLQEMRRLDLVVENDEIEQGFARLAQQNNFEPEQFRAILQRSGINLATMHRQIEAQLGWSKVIQTLLRSRVNITDTDIDAQLERLRNDAGRTEYFLAEIFLPVENSKDENDTRQLAQKLRADIVSGKVPFPKVAQQFSKAAGASQGGIIGWVQTGQLAEKLAAAVQGMEPGSVSQPIRSLNGYHILFLREKRTISAQNLPSREEILSRLGLERLERMQKKHLQDLKAAAFIENRVQP